MTRKELIESIYSHFHFGPIYKYECVPEIEFTIKRNKINYSGKIKSFQQYRDDCKKPALLFEISDELITNKCGNSIKLKSLNKKNIPLNTLNSIYLNYIKGKTNKW